MKKMPGVEKEINRGTGKRKKTPGEMAAGAGHTAVLVTKRVMN